MFMTKKFNILIILSILLTSCGFKKINLEKSLINLQDVNISGENRIAYELKNNIFLISDVEAKNKYNLKMTITKKKTIKIKNKKGKTSRFELNISSDLSLTNINTQEIIYRSFAINSAYDVAKNHSETIRNEKSALKNATQRLSDEVTNFIILSSTN